MDAGQGIPTEEYRVDSRGFASVYYEVMGIYQHRRTPLSSAMALREGRKRLSCHCSAL